MELELTCMVNVPVKCMEKLVKDQLPFAVAVIPVTISLKNKETIALGVAVPEIVNDSFT